MNQTVSGYLSGYPTAPPRVTSADAGTEVWLELIVLIESYIEIAE